MQNIDIRTLILVSTIISTVIALTFGVVTGNFHARNRATVWWAFGFLSRALGFLLIFLRGRVPDFLSVPFANALLVMGALLLALGIDVYADRRPRHRLAASLFAFSIVLLVVVNYGQPLYSVRIFALSILLLGINTYIGVTLLSLHGGVRLQQRVSAGIFLASATAMGVRGFLSILGPAQTSLFVPSVSSMIGFCEAFIIPVCAVISLLSMVTQASQIERDRTIGDLTVVLGSVKLLSGLLPICASCKKIRDEEGHWHEVEVYVRDHSEVDFSHGLCPECTARLYGT